MYKILYNYILICCYSFFNNYNREYKILIKRFKEKYKLI